MSKTSVNHEWTLSRCIEFAKKLTLEAANAKDYKLTRKHDRRFKEIAQGLIKDGRGYIIATDVELAAKYPDLVTWKPSDADHKIVWAVRFESLAKVGNKMAFLPIR